MVVASTVMLRSLSIARSADTFRSPVSYDLSYRTESVLARQIVMQDIEYSLHAIPVRRLRPPSPVVASQHCCARGFIQTRNALGESTHRLNEGPLSESVAKEH